MSVSTLSRGLRSRNGTAQILSVLECCQLHSLTRALSTKQLSPTISYITKTQAAGGSVKGRRGHWELNTDGRPLSILLCWLMAKNNAVNKYANFYLDKGFDVLTVRITPAQLLLPAKTNKIVETELMPILRSSHHEQSIIHGFSVGGYVFAQMLRVAKENPTEYASTVQKIMAQIWDSVVDVEGTAIGVSKSVFPNSLGPQKALKQFIDLWMKVMEPISTKHYFTAHEYFYNAPHQAPALFLNSENDPISPMSVINNLQATWTSKTTIPVTTKVWSNTPHVGHMQRHPDEYKQTVNAFLEKVGVKGAEGGELRDAPKQTLKDFNPAYNVITS